MSDPDQPQLFPDFEVATAVDDPWELPEIGSVPRSEEGLELARRIGATILAQWVRLDIPLRQLGIRPMRWVNRVTAGQLNVVRVQLVLLLSGAVAPDEAPEAVRTLLQAWSHLAEERRSVLEEMSGGEVRELIRRENDLADTPLQELLSLANALDEEVDEESEIDLDPYYEEAARRLRDRDDGRSLPSSLTLRALLTWLPLEWLDAAHFRMCGAETPRRRDRQKELVYVLTSDDELEGILRDLDTEARRALAFLLDNGGSAPLEALTRKFGDEAGDMFPWIPEPPLSALGQLRSCALTFVGRSDDGGGSGPTVVVPVDLRQTLTRLLDQLDADDSDDPDAIVENARTTARSWCAAMLEARGADDDTAWNAIDALEEIATLMATYQGERPEDWTEAALIACLLEDVPRKVSADDLWFEELPGFLADTLEWAGAAGAHPRGAELARAVRDNARRVLRAAKDPARWGMAKQVVMQARSEGVDMSDPAARDAFIARWNQAPPPPPTTVRSNKVGRNQPCPCGSGKKFKRCCGR